MALVERGRVTVLRNDLRDRVLVHVAHEDRLAEHGLVVQPRAAVSVAAGADLEVERAVHAVLLCAVDARQVLRAAAALFAATSAAHALALSLAAVAPSPERPP